ncbi:MAG: hypothetical protein WB792_11670 [Desulfobacterales bacterium]
MNSVEWKVSEWGILEFPGVRRYSGACFSSRKGPDTPALSG